MSTTATVVGLSVAIILVITVVTFLLWSSRVSPRRGETLAARYRREMGNLHSPRNRRGAERARRRRQMWAAGTAGTLGTYYLAGGGDYDHGSDSGGSDGGCGGGSGCGGGGCGGGGGS
jgi:hypothetical protein